MRRSSPLTVRAPALRVAPLVLLALALTACRADEAAPAPSAEPGRGGTLVIGAGHDIEGVNPLLAASSFSNQVQGQLFLGLLDEQPDFQEHPPTFAPELATSFEFSDDRLALTLELRPEAIWSDGTPITAEDVRWTWRAQTAPGIAWAYAQSKRAITDVEVVGRHTVRYHFSRAYPGQLTDVNEGAVLPRHAWDAKPFDEWRRDADWFRRHLVVSGPYELAAWRPQQEIVLARNSAYHDPERPRLDRVVFRIVPETSNQVTGLRAGYLDFVHRVPPEEAEELAGRADLEVAASWSRQYTYLGWNNTLPLFADPAVRRALTLGIDRQGIVDALWDGYARVATSPIISTVWAHDRTLEPWPHDPEEAARRLEAAGWRDSDGDGVRDRDGRPFSFELLASASSRSRRDAAVMIQQQLAAIGVEARTRLLEVNTLTDRFLSRDFEAVISGWAIDTSLDPSYAFHSDSIGEGGYNFVTYSNPRVDQLLGEARRTLEPGPRKEILVEVQRILHREQPYTFLWESQVIDGFTARLRGFRPNPLGTYRDLEEWWLADAE